MKVSLTQTENTRFEATTSRGVKFDIEPKERVSPLEYFAIATIACSATDIVSLSAKAGKPAGNLTIEGEFDRSDGAPYRVVSIHILYSFDSGGLDAEALKWVLSSLESYCTTINTVRGVAKVYYSIAHNGKLIADRASIASGESGA
ncbi:MAG: OsmC family protein, partial [Helicobacteraceae bacterium]|nr:OsmC family protein [Helicobacteraceae bacterium]